MPNDNKLKLLEEAFDDKDLLLFYLAWLKHGLNATQAYKELHPDTKPDSCRVLGSKWLARINKTMIMQAYGLDAEAYFNQLKEGLNAKGMTKDGNEYDDHRARRPYHEVLGKLLGVEEREKDQSGQYTQYNIFNIDREETQKLKKSFQNYMLEEKQ